MKKKIPIPNNFDYLFAVWKAINHISPIYFLDENFFEINEQLICETIEVQE